MPKVRIMVVEDESIIAVDIKRTLINLGYEVSYVAETGEDAVRAAAEDKPDLVLMDIVLKGNMDGVEAAAIISKNCRIPVVYLTAHEDEKTLERTKTTNPYGFILKPFQERDLNTTLTMALYKSEAEKKLAESEKRYFRLTENARDMIYRVSLTDGRYEYANKASLDITGYTPEEFYDTPLLIKEIIHPDWRHYFDVQWSRLLEGDAPPVYEYQIIHKNGDVRWFNQRNVLIKDENGNPIALEGIVTDITEQKKSEQIIRKQQEEYRLIFDTVPAMVFYKDDNNKMLRVNKLAAKVKGSTVEEMEGKYTEDFYPDEADKFLADDRKVIASGEPMLGIIERLESGTGEKLWIKTDKIPYRNEKGQIIGVLAFAQDITRQKQTEEQLLKSEHRNAVLINTIPDILFKFDVEGIFTDCSVKNEDDIFFLPKEFMNKKIEDVLPCEFGKLLKEQIRKAIETNEIQTFESEVYKDNRSKYFETRLVLSGDNEVLAIMRDISLRKQAYKDLEESEEKYRKLTNNAPIAITRLRVKDLKYDFVNDEFVRQTGYTKDEFNNLSIDHLAGLIHPEDRDTVKNTYEQWAKRGFSGVAQITYRVFNRAGKQMWLDTYHYADLGKDGKPIAVNQLYIDITEQKRFESELRLSERKFRAVTEVTPSAVYIVQGDKFIYGNKYAEELTGYSLDESLNLNFWDIIHPDHKEMVKERGMARLRGEDAPNRYQAKIITKNGEERWIDLTITSFEFEGKPAILGNAQDITEQKKSHEALLLSEGKFRKLSENAPVAITRLLVETSNYEFVNEEFTRQSGYTMAEFNSLSDKELIEMIYPDDRKRIFEFYKKWSADRHKGMQRIDYRIINRNKKVVWLDTYLYAEFDPPGTTKAIVQLCVDVSERKAAEEALKQSELKFRAVAEAIQASIVITKGDRFVYANPHFEKISGFSAGELKQKNFIDFIHPDYRKAVLSRIKVLASGDVVSPDFECRVITNNKQEMWTQISSVMIEVGDEPAVLSLILDITDMKNAQDLIRLSEEKFRAVSESMPAEIVIFQNDRFIYANPYAEILTGYPISEILGRYFWEFTHPDFQEMVIQRGRSRLKGEKVTERYEMKILTKDGNAKWVDYSAANIVFNNMPAVLGTAIDISERKLVVEALKESEARYRAIVEDQTEMIYRWDLDGTLTYVNDAYCRYFKKTADELLGTKFYITIPTEDYQEFEKHFKSLNYKNPAGTIEHRMIMQDNVIRWQRWTDRALFDDNKNIIGYQSVGRDITESKNAAEELAKSEERYRAFIQQSSEGIYRMELEKPVPTDIPIEEQIELMYKFGYVAECNETMAKMYGLKKAEELIGKRMAELLVKSDPHNIEYNTSFVLNGYKISDYESHEIDKDGNPVYFLNNAIGIVENNKLLRMWGTQRDITVIKKTEEQIKQSLQEKEILLKEVHHRVKNNLQIITSLLKLQSTYVKDKQALDLFKESQSRVQSMALIHQKLYQSKNLGKIDFGEYLRTLVAHIMQSFGSLACSIKVEIESEEVYLSIDNAIPCGLIINELVTNAYKHAFKGRTKGVIQISLKQKQSKYTLEVKDNGIGIPSHINFPNSPTFGLKLISTLVDQIRGTMHITRTKGSNFKIVFEQSSL